MPTGYRILFLSGLPVAKRLSLIILEGSPYQTEAVATAVRKKILLRRAAILKGNLESQSNNYAKSNVNRRAGIARAISLGWLWQHECGTYVKFTESGAALFA